MCVHISLYIDYDIYIYILIDIASGSQELRRANLCKLQVAKMPTSGSGILPYIYTYT